MTTIEAASGSFALLDMTPYGRGEAWQASPHGWPEGHDPARARLLRRPSAGTITITDAKSAGPTIG